MQEALCIETERMDDLPLLLTHMQRMYLSQMGYAQKWVWITHPDPEYTATT